MTFLSCRKPFLYIGTSQKYVSSSFSKKSRHDETLNFCPESWVTPLEKCKFSDYMWKWHFYSLKAFFFIYNITLYKYFDYVNLNRKMQICRLCKKWHFYSLKSFLFYKQHHENTYLLGLFQRKTDSREILNFWPNFGKMQIFWLCENDTL